MSGRRDGLEIHASQRKGTAKVDVPRGVAPDEWAHVPDGWKPCYRPVPEAEAAQLARLRNGELHTGMPYRHGPPDMDSERRIRDHGYMQDINTVMQDTPEARTSIVRELRLDHARDAYEVAQRKARDGPTFRPLA